MGNAVAADRSHGGLGAETDMIAIITDSTCDIPEALLQQYGITVIPNIIVWGDHQYRDRVDLTPEEFYRRLPLEPERPTTSTPSVEDFHRTYVAAIDRGADSIIMLTVSSAMSGVYQLAVNAGKEARVPVTVIDSKGPTMSLGWQVLAAARLRDTGADVAAIVARLARIREHMHQLVCMTSLEYLSRGGRIGQAVKWVGVKLQVKPVVSINHQTGLVEPVGLSRTHTAAVDLLITKFVGLMRGMCDLHIAVMHGGAPQEAAALAERIRDELNPVEMLTNMTGPVLGVNTGPGALALCGYGDDPKA